MSAPSAEKRQRRAKRKARQTVRDAEVRILSSGQQDGFSFVLARRRTGETAELTVMRDGSTPSSFTVWRKEISVPTGSVVGRLSFWPVLQEGMEAIQGRERQMEANKAQVVVDEAGGVTPEMIVAATDRAAFRAGRAGKSLLNAEVLRQKAAREAEWGIGPK